MKRVILPQRWEQIIEQIEEQGRASVEEIAQTLGISPATVRRDLARLKERGLIRRTRGGAEPSAVAPPWMTIAESRRLHPREKELIGRVAAELVKPGESVIIDGGFTTYQLARHIEAPGLKLVTNSLDVAQAVAGRRDMSLVILGGELLPESATTVGPVTVRQVLEMTADKAFLGADALSPAEGLCSPRQLTAETKKAMIRSAREVIVLADHSKLGKFALYRIAPLEAITTLITDDQAEEGTRLEAFRAAEVEVIIASARETEEVSSEGNGTGRGGQI